MNRNGNDGVLKYFEFEANKIMAISKKVKNEKTSECEIKKGSRTNVRKTIFTDSE